MSESPSGVRIESRSNEYIGVVSEGYQKLNQALNNYFAEQLDSTDIKSIRIRDPRKSRLMSFTHRSPSKDLGVWNVDSKIIDLFVDAHEVSGTYLQRTLFHEGGHAFSSRRIEGGNKGEGPLRLHTPFTAREALAEWISVIAANDGDKDRVRQTLGGWVKKHPEHRLFSSLLKQSYPNQADKLSDAALLDYLFRRYGLQSVSGIVQGLSKWITLRDASGVDRLFQGIVTKKYHDFDHLVKVTTGKDLEELSHEAHRFFTSVDHQPTPRQKSTWRTGINPRLRK